MRLWRAFVAGGLLLALAAPAMAQVPVSVQVPADAASVDGFSASWNPTPGTLLALDGQARFPLSVLQPCAPGQILKYSASGWGCNADAGGSSYSAGPGLSLSGSTFSAAYGGSGGDAGTAATLARSDHRHDARYALATALATAGTINAPSNPVSWTKLKDVPVGLADGIDNDSGGDITGVVAGAGLTGGAAAGEATLAIAPNGVTSEMTSNEAAVKTSTPSGLVSLSTSVTTLRSVTVTFPSAGFAMVTAQSEFKNETAANYALMRLFRDGTAIATWDWEPGDVDGFYDQTQSKQVVVPVTAGTSTFRLDGSVNAGTAATYYNELIVVFFPSSL